jgi:SpoIVB peptidase S55
MKIKPIAALIIIVLVSWAAAGATTLTMPVSQIKAGMKGKGKSVFKGADIQEFDAEILGVVENSRPKRNVILARLSGMGLENSGVIQGMSGSPVYIDGKLIGAVAYSFAFAKEPIAGITPIEEMMAISGAGQPAGGTPVPGGAIRSSLSLDDLLAMESGFFAGRNPVSADGRALVPIGVPLVFGGFSTPVLDRARSVFTRWGFSPLSGGAGGQAPSANPSPVVPLREGDPVAVELVRGDLSVAAVGTVTYADGNKILAFGHPLYNLGPVDYAMSRANVLGVVPSLESSFKLAQIGAPAGRITQDRPVGALGEVGGRPRLIPLSIKLTEATGAVREFKVEIIRDKILSALLVNMTVASLLSSEERSYGNITYAMDGDVYLENGSSVHLEDVFSGNLDTAPTSLSGLLTAVVFYLANNEFEDAGIHQIELRARAFEEVRFATLERIWLDKYEAAPGERIQVRIYYRTYGGEILQEAVDIDAPPLPAGSEFSLVIADAASMHQLETSLYRSQDFVPRSFSQLVRLLNSLRKNNRIYFKMMASKPGLFLKGEEMPNLPPSLKSMFASPRATSSPTELTRSTLREYQLPIPYVFRGMAAIPVRIKQ